ncbi:helix-turn-helix domain-containing protein [Streptacidiphilus sp. N1-12]|uniref:Helix-turn-helix domain-containing protein n=2 Tax=Streptacidiphilus alkalitolerans TaxID=3342712 RepID=A0ABV6V9G0_9ACTN
MTGQREHRARPIGADRERMLADLKRRYEAGASIRQLMQLTRRSYGCIHQRLTAAGVQLRPPGKDQRLTEGDPT